jgi:hypothetical protein
MTKLLSRELSYVTIYPIKNLIYKSFVFVRYVFD